MRKIIIVAGLALALAACGGRSGENNEVQHAQGHGGAEHGTEDNK